MSTLQQYTLQLENLQSLLNFLSLFQSDMDEKIRNYRQRADSMLYDGLPLETFEKLVHVHIAHTNHLVQKAVGFIEDQTRPFVVENIITLDEQIKLNS